MATNYRAKHREKVRLQYRRKAMPLMSQEWYPDAIKAELPNAGSMITTPWRGVLHTTEGSSYQGAYNAYKANNSAPHFTVSFEGGSFKCWQHIPLTRAARSLKNPAGGVETNRTRCIQIEIVGFAGSSGSLPPAYIDGIGRLMRWVEAQTGLSKQGPGRGFAGSYAERNKYRFSGAEWNSFSGWCGHCHVPENDHWDPGHIDISALLQVSIGVKPMFDPSLLIRVAWWGADPNTGGVYILQDDGAVFGITGQYFGGANGQPYFAGRQAAKMIFPGDPEWTPSAYKYRIVATSGEQYGYPS